MKSSRTERRARARLAVPFAAVVLTANGCAVMHRLNVGVLPRPTVLAAEWIDLRHTTPGDTMLWVLRDDGYDGAARLVADPAAGERRSETRYGSWYFDGDLADSTHRAICFSKRIGRNGATCLAFSLDTVSADGAARRRLIVRGYRGQHYTGDRELIERISSSSP